MTKTKKWLNPYPIECGCGHADGPFGQKRMCATKCMVNFRVTDYPPGYFFHVGKLRCEAKSDGHAQINTCPPCETEVHRMVLANSLLNGHISKQERIRQEYQASITLLEEWKLTTPRQEKNVRRLYGDDVLRVMQECADETDRTKAKTTITEQVCIAMSDLPPSRIHHKRLVEDLGPVCQGCTRGLYL